jgi:hypothetical protein
MKKLIIVLMVVAMASFLFTGCLKGVTTDTTTDTTTTTVTVPATKAPVITAVTGVSLTSTATQYVNKAESPVTGIVVGGTAPTYSEVKVYLDGIVAGTADTLAGSTWSCVITLSELGKDGAKTVHATAEEPGCTESKKSNEVKFILDRTPPKMTSVAAYWTGIGHYKIGFSEDVDISVDVVANPQSALNPLNWSVTMAAPPNTIFAVGDMFTAVSTKVISIVPLGSGNFPTAIGASYAIYSWLIEDVAGNTIAGAPLPTALWISDAVIHGIVLP